MKIALLVGGSSPEREISKRSGFAVYNALKEMEHEIIVIDPAYGRNQSDDISKYFEEKDFAGISNKNYTETFQSELFSGIDLAVIALHGKWGEDGTVQSLLELKGIKYTGSKILASAAAMDKNMSKILFRHFKVGTAKWITASPEGYEPKLLSKIIKKDLGFPCVIKPNDQGSTVGLTICKNKNQVEEALALAFKFSDKALIEKYIPGRELTVAILEKEPLPVLEIKPKHGVYDYECKYTSGMSEYEVPAKLPDKVKKKLQAQALLAFNSLGCEGYARVDFRLNKKNEIFCLEVNSLPGMTATSLVPKMAKAAGISFQELLDRIMKAALK
ncbi:MAG TPA: D-alanine--D-alanine ligase [Ignavibacteriaceae bacterium]|nr:D-alanine--D-alanine ligase [Ignavibacteriaceae bacterium]